MVGGGGGGHALEFEINFRVLCHFMQYACPIILLLISGLKLLTHSVARLKRHQNMVRV